MGYRKSIEKKANLAPKRLIFYRGMSFHCIIERTRNSQFLDGVSEGQFQTVLDEGTSISVDRRYRLYTDETCCGRAPAYKELVSRTDPDSFPVLTLAL